MIKVIKKKLQNIFKLISYGMFLLLYGKIKGVSKNDVQIQETKLEKNISYKIFFIKNSRFYTDTINDTAFIKDNLIIDGPSFQFRDNKNAQTKENIVFQKGTPRLKKKLMEKF